MNNMELLNCLREIHELMKNPDNWNDVGICGGIKFVKMKIVPELFFSKWPKWSGNLHFPVPAAYEIHEGDPDDAFMETEFPDLTSMEYMWDRKKSKYAALRWELLEWAISELEKELSQ